MKIYAYAILSVVGLILFVLACWWIYKIANAKKEAEQKRKAVDLSKFKKYLTSAGNKQAMLDELVRLKTADKNALRKPDGSNKKAFILDAANAQKISKEIYDSQGLISDDETACLQSINGVPSLIDLLLVNQSLENLYTGKGRDIISYITSFQNEEELSKIYDVLEGKPVLIIK